MPCVRIRRRKSHMQDASTCRLVEPRRFGRSYEKCDIGRRPVSIVSPNDLDAAQDEIRPWDFALETDDVNERARPTRGCSVGTFSERISLGASVMLFRRGRLCDCKH